MANVLIERLSHSFADQINPVLVKELRQSLHGKILYMNLLMIAVLEILSVYAAVAAELEFGGGRRITGAFAFYAWVFAILSLVSPLSVLMRWGNERQTDGISPEFTTALSPAKIARGKLTAVTALFLLNLTAGAPGLLWFLFRCPVWHGGAVVRVGVLLLTILFWGGAFTAMIPPNRKNRSTGTAGAGLCFCGAFFAIAFASVKPPVEISQIGYSAAWTIGCVLLSWTALLLTEGAILPEMANRFWKGKTAIGMSLIGFYFLLLLLGLTPKRSLLVWSLTTMVFAGGLAMVAAIAPFHKTRRCEQDLPRWTVSRFFYRFSANRVIPGYLFALFFLACGALILTAGTTAAIPSLQWQETSLRSIDGVSALGCCGFFYANCTLILRRWMPRTNPIALLASVLLICNGINVLGAIHETQIFTVVSPIYGLLSPSEALPLMAKLAGGSFLALLLSWGIPMKKAPQIIHQ
ncbi:MAG: hypothetical protein PHS41_06625 [Victivallaceae bacterium]|nr:hypothetical protein [Victivallaceae bacterium]